MFPYFALLFANPVFALQWVYNIIEGRQEVERIIYRDADFLLLPDLKWSGIQTEDLYVVGLVIDRNIGSLRDLRGEHLPLLRAIHDKGKVRSCGYWY